MKKRFNVDSPSFTPAAQNGATLAVNGTPTKALGLSPKAASAAPFKPKGLSSGLTSGSSCPAVHFYEKKGVQTLMAEFRRE